MSTIKTAYIQGVYQSAIDHGILAPTSMEKIAQQADVASATMDEVGMVGSSISPQDISSLAKILSVLTQLQQIHTEMSMMPPQEMQGQMPPQGMPPQGQPAPMGPPPQGMQAPGPGPAMQ